VRIAVTGSLAYDYIMDFPGYFRDYILPEKLHMLSVSFLVDSLRRLRGGVAGNIAYNLALLGERPLLVSAAGHDFGEYRAWLESQGVDTSGVKEISGEFTASCFFNTDKDNNQIVAFYPGANGHDRTLSLVAHGLGPDDIVVISPTDPDAIERYARECQAHGIPYVFDPGKQTPRLDARHIEAGLAGAAVLMGNDYEYTMMAREIGKSEEALLASVPLAVVTRGKEGSRIYSRDGAVVEVPIAPVAEVRDPTGAGDAYLAGLVFGLTRKLPLGVAGRIGALCSAYTIEQKGCQEHSFSLEEFARRYATAFGAELLLESDARATLSAVPASSNI
jgi:adenosine kinase